MDARDLFEEGGVALWHWDGDWQWEWERQTPNAERGPGNVFQWK